MPGASRDLCIRCKGVKYLCNLSYCPLIHSYKAKISLLKAIDKPEVSGSSPPSIIIGEKGYPQVMIYYGVPPGIFGNKAKIFDDPYRWFISRKSLGDIIEYRSKLIHLAMRINVNKPYILYEKEIGLASLSQKPVDTEAVLKKKPVPRISFNYITPPRGPSAPAKIIKITSNPIIHRRIDKIIWDDVKASEGVWELYKSGVDFYTIVRAFTLGFIGLRDWRRIVPTRWGITAVDTILANKMLKEIRCFRLINNILVFYGEYLYNKYLIVLSPGKYRGLWIEVWQPRALWNPSETPAYLIVKESHNGKVSIMDGGYMAARFSVLEYLYRIKKQAKVLILREVKPQYIIPVGNWQIRETVKQALRQGPLLKDPRKHELMDYIKNNFNIPSKLIDLAIEFVYKVREESLDKWINK